MLHKDIRITIGGESFSSLRIKLDIEHASYLFGRATAYVYGLSNSTYDSLEYDSLSTIEVLTDTGYEVIFIGNFRYQERYIEDRSIISALSFFNSVDTYKEKIQVSFDVDTKAEQVIDYFRKQMPLLNIYISPKAKSKIDNVVFKGGLVISGGDYYNSLHDFIVDHIGSEFSPFFDSENIIIGDRNLPPITINKDNGMIGSAEFRKRLVKNKSKDSEFEGKVSVRLMPSITIYDKINVISEYSRTSNVRQFNSGQSLSNEQYNLIRQTGSGLYLVTKINHICDTHGSDWKTNLSFIGILDD